MGQNVISRGPGNENNIARIEYFKCGAGITKGNAVTWNGDNNYTVKQGTNALKPIGIAEATGVTGAWIPVTVGGYTATTITTDGNADAGDILIAAASGATVAVAPASVSAAQAMLAFGVATAADSSNDLVGAIIWNQTL